MPLHFPDACATFIHIPKNAGNSLERWAIDQELKFEDKSNHCTLVDARKLWDDLGLVFSFVRNPFSRVVSIYHYLGQHAERKILKKRSVNITDDLKTISLYKKGFDYWINCLCDADSEFNERPYIKNINGESYWPRRATQSSWFEGDNLDLFFKIENLDVEFNRVQEILKCNSECPIGRVNSSDHGYYKEYYNQQNIQIVRNMFKEDLDRFNYDY